jgi:hypothetical protein
VLLGFATCLGTRGYLLGLAMSISALAGGSTRTEPWSGGSTLAAPLLCKQRSYTVGAYWAQNTGGDNTALLTRSPHFFLE